ncbi:MAG: precorrin-6A reductase [Nitrospinota bacterium]|nr:precorrin-6A reductase [Nitrospinota bacterium]
MILLIGGTSETGNLAAGIVALGQQALALTATDTELNTGQTAGVERRVGRLDKGGMTRLIQERDITVVVDASHPYAAQVRANARAAAVESRIPYLTYVRPTQDHDYDQLYRVDSHEAAAELAFSFGAPTLLATGSRNITPYARMARRTGQKVVARVLDNPESLDACRMGGLLDEEVITGRGPFTVEQNLSTIGEHEIGVLVTKDSGAAGGVAEKIEAARSAGIPVVMVDRPDHGPGEAFDDIGGLLAALESALDGAESKRS